MWTAFTIPFVLVAIVVATGPVYYMTYHSKRYGHVASKKEAKDPQAFGWDDLPRVQSDRERSCRTRGRRPLVCGYLSTSQNLEIEYSALTPYRKLVHRQVS